MSCCFSYCWGLPWCSISTVCSSSRVVSTVITTARWEGKITPTWPYLPATACSKWTAELCVILAVFRISVETLFSALIDSVSTVFSPLSSLSAWQRDVWWWSLYVSNWTLATDSFSCKLSLSQKNKNVNRTEVSSCYSCRITSITHAHHPLLLLLLTFFLHFSIKNILLPAPLKLTN